MSTHLLGLPFGMSAGPVARLMGLRSLEDWGSVSLAGQADASAIINQAIQDTAAAGEVLLLRTGLYRLDNPIYGRSGAMVICSPRTVLSRNFSQSGTTGLLMNPDMTTPLSEFRWSGGRIRNPAPASLAGNSVCLNANDSMLEDLFFDEWSSAGRAMLLFGNQLTLNRMRGASANNGGGIRFAGGDDFRCSDAWMYCGDDCFQFVPGATTGSTLFNRTIRRGQFMNCHGWSWNARLCAAALVSTSETLHMTASILDSGFIGIRGRSGRVGVTVENEDSTGMIARLAINDVQVDCTSAAAATTGSCYIAAATGTGGVEDVQLNRLTVLGPLNQAVQIVGVSGTVRRVSLDGCYLDAPRTAGTPTLIAQGATTVKSRRTYYKANGADAVQIGNGSSLVTDTTSEGDTFDQIDNTKSGINFACATGGAVRDGRFIERSGQTSARAITLAGGAEGTGAVKLDIDTASCNFAGLSLSEPVVLNTTSSAENRVLANGVTRTHTSNVALRRHEAGSVRIANSASTITLSLPTPGASVEFTVMNLGAGNCVVQAAAGHTIRDATTLGASGGSATGPQGSALRIVGLSATEWAIVAKVGSWTVA